MPTRFLLKLDRYKEQYGIETAKEFLLTGKFETSFSRQSNISDETSATSHCHILTDSASRIRDSFANLLVFQKVLSESSHASIKTLSLHEFPNQTINPVLGILNNKKELLRIDK